MKKIMIRLMMAIELVNRMLSEGVSVGAVEGYSQWAQADAELALADA